MRTLPDVLALPDVYPSPPVNWVGGKSGLLDQIIPLLPADVRSRRLHEPFAGGAALFFRLLPRSASLSDTCADLIGLYRVLRDGPHSTFFAHLRELESSTNPKVLFETIRHRLNDDFTVKVEQRAAWFLYLNRAGFNGLHRVNARGELNTPHGGKKRITFDIDNLLACGRALQDTLLMILDFEHTLDRAAPGDVVYFDPPYLNTFSSYSGEFDWRKHVELAHVFRTLDKRGVVVVLSTNDEPAIRDLYQGFEITVVNARRVVGARASSRGKVEELVIRGHTR